MIRTFVTILLATSFISAPLVGFASKSEAKAVRVCVDGGRYGVLVRDAQGSAVLANGQPNLIPKSQKWCGTSSLAVVKVLRGVDWKFVRITFDNGRQGLVVQDLVLKTR